MASSTRRTGSIVIPGLARCGGAAAAGPSRRRDARARRVAIDAMRGHERGQSGLAQPHRERDTLGGRERREPFLAPTRHVAGDVAPHHGQYTVRSVDARGLEPLLSDV